MKRLRRYFVTGLIVVIPVFLTIYILAISFKFLDGILGKYLNEYFKNYPGFYIPGLGFILFFLIIILAGFIATRLFGRKIYPQLEKWFSGLPLINKIYPTLKQLVLFILAQKEFGFQKVVLVEYQSKGIWSVGFLTNEQYAKISSSLN